MKNLLVFLPFITFLAVVPAEKPQWLGFPEEITRHVVCYFKPGDIAALKKTCSQWNKIFDYDMLHPDTVAAINEVVCTQIISRLAHDTEQEKNFLLFYNNNNTEKRNEALKLLGWECDGSNVKQLMLAHCQGWGCSTTLPDWDNIFNNNIALNIICFSDNPNIQNQFGNTVLIRASNDEKYTEIVKRLLANPNTNVNIQNKEGGTALMWASSLGYTNMVQILLAHPNIDIDIQNKDGNTALILGSEYREIIALLEPSV